jgi:hypothetical protein
MAKVPPNKLQPNPKQEFGDKKVPIHLWPLAATILGSLGLAEGRAKYGRNNWRAQPVLASTYIRAALSHIQLYAEAEDLAQDTGNPHLANALASLAILADAQMHGTLIDDRNYVPPASKMAEFIKAAEEQYDLIKVQFADRKPKHWTVADNDE